LKTSHRLLSRLHWLTILALAVVVLSIGAACGDDDSGGDDSTATNTPAGTDAGTATTDAGGEAITLKIGSIEDLSGTNSSAALLTAEGTQFAADTINEAGGFEVNGQRYLLEVVERDTRSDASVAASAAQELVRDEEVIAMFGTQLETGVPAIPITQEAGVIHFMSPTAMEPELDNPDNCCLFRSSISSKFRDPVWLQGAADALHESDPSLTTVAMIFPNNATFQALAGIWGDAATAAGLEIIDTQLYEPGTTDFSGLVSAVASKDPDIIFGPPQATDSQALIRQAIELGVGKAFLFPAVPLSIGATALGQPLDQPLVSMYTGAQFAEPSTAELQTFIDDWIAWRGGGDIPPQNPESVLFFYDSVFQLVEAMQEAGCVPENPGADAGADDCSASIVDILATTPFTGIRGTIQYDETHRVRYPVDVCKIVVEDITCVSLDA